MVLFRTLYVEHYENFKAQFHYNHKDRSNEILTVSRVNVSKDIIQTSVVRVKRKSALKFSKLFNMFRITLIMI